MSWRSFRAAYFAVDWAVNSEVFGERARPRVVGACALAFVTTLGVVNAWLHPLHRVRVRDGDCKPVALPNQRPTVGAAAGARYAQAKSAYAKVHGEGPVPMLVVATAGGGIRAAYWTATIFERLEADFKDQGGVRPYLFAISGVSGGSVGATAFDAAVIKRDENHCMAGKPGDASVPGRDRFSERGFPGARGRELGFYGCAVEFSCRISGRAIAARRSKRALNTRATACWRGPS